MFGKVFSRCLIMNIDDLLCVGATDNIMLSSKEEEIKFNSRSYCYH